MEGKLQLSRGNLLENETTCHGSTTNSLESSSWLWGNLTAAELGFSFKNIGKKNLFYFFFIGSNSTSTRFIYIYIFFCWNDKRCNCDKELICLSIQKIFISRSFPEGEKKLLALKFYFNGVLLNWKWKQFMMEINHETQ